MFNVPSKSRNTNVNIFKLCVYVRVGGFMQPTGIAAVHKAVWAKLIYTGNVF